MESDGDSFADGLDSAEPHRNKRRTTPKAEVLICTLLALCTPDKLSTAKLSQKATCSEIDAKCQTNVW